MSHVMMKKNLAKALWEASMEDINGEEPQKLGLGGVVKSVFSPVGQILGGATDALAPKNTFDASDPNTIQQRGLYQQQQADIYKQQQGLAQALLAQSQGQGPNPALLQLQQATGQNVANQSALMAGARGASVNPALIARQAAMQGANIQQNAIGQAGILQAQQQMAAQQALAQQQAQMAGVAMNGQNLYMGAMGQQQAINAGVANQNNAIRGQIMGGLANATGMIGQMGGKAATGGAMPSTQGPTMAGENSMSAVPLASDGGLITGKAVVSGDSKANDNVPTLLSPGEIVIPRSVVQSDNPPKEAAKFIKELMARNPKGYGGVISARNKVKEVDGSIQKLNQGGVTLNPLLDQQQPMQNPYSPMQPAPAQPSMSFLTSPVAAGTDTPTTNPFIDVQQKQASQNLGIPIDKTKQPEIPSLGDADVVSGANAQNADTQGSGTPSMAGPMGEALNAEKQESRGIGEFYDTQGELAKENAKIYQQQQVDLQNSKQDYEAKRDLLKARSDDIYNKVSSQEIDPNQYWANKSTGSKISTVFGVLLGGLGQGLTGSNHNMVWDALQKNIDKDIESQKDNMNKNNNLYRMNREMLGDEKDAYLQTKTDMLAMSAAQLNQMAAKSGSPMAQAQKDMMLGKFGQEIAKNHLALQGAQLGRQAITDGIHPDLVPVLPEKQREQMVTLPNGMMADAGSKESAAKYKESTGAYQAIMGDLQELKSLNTLGGRIDPAQRARSEVLQNQIVNDLNDMAQAKRISEADIGFQKGKLSDTTSIKNMFSSDWNAATDQLITSVNRKWEAVGGQQVQAFSKMRGKQHAAQKSVGFKEK